MESHVLRYYKINKYFLCVAGMWPYQTLRKRLFLRFVMTFCVLTVQAVQIARFVTCKGNAECILQTTPVFILHLIIYVKVYTYGLQTTKIKTLFELILAEWRTLKSKEEIEIMEKYVARGRQYTVYYAVFIYATALGAALPILTPQMLDLIKPLNHSRSVILLYPAEYFVDETENYAYIFAHMITALIIMLLALIGADTMFLSYTEYVNGAFAVVAYRFQHSLYQYNATGTLYQDPVSTESPKNAYQEIFADTIKMHLRTVNYVKYLSSVYTVPFAIMLGLNTVIMSLTLLQIVMVLDRTEEALRYLVYVIGQVLHLLCISFQGQKIIDSSTTVADKIYNGLWYATPVEMQKNLLIPLRQCLEPCYLSAGKIYIFSLESFTSVMRASMSYFTLLSSMR